MFKSIKKIWTIVFLLLPILVITPVKAETPTWLYNPESCGQTSSGNTCCHKAVLFIIQWGEVCNGGTTSGGIKTPTGFTPVSDCASGYGGISYKNGKFEIHAPCEIQGGKNSFGQTMKGGADSLYRGYIYVWSASCVIAMISLVVGAVQLAGAAGNQQKTQRAWSRIKISLIVLAGLGGARLIIGFAFQLFA